MSDGAPHPEGGAHPAIARIFAEMQGQRITFEHLADQTQVSMQTLFHWRRGRDARLANVEAALNALGLRLTVEALPRK